MTSHPFLPGPLDVERCFTCGEKHEEKQMDNMRALAEQVADTLTRWRTQPMTDSLFRVEATTLIHRALLLPAASHPDACEHGVRLKNYCGTCAALAVLQE